MSTPKPKPKVNGHTIYSPEHHPIITEDENGEGLKKHGPEELSSFDLVDEEQEFMSSNRRGSRDDDKIIQLLEQLVDRKDKTALPNWLMPIIILTFISLLGFVYTTMNDRILDMRKASKDEVEKLERRLDTQETFTKNSREKLIENGWTFTDDGKIIKRK